MIDPLLEIVESVEKNENPSIEVRLEIRLTRIQGSDWWVNSADHSRVIRMLRMGMTLLEIRTETRDPECISPIHWTKANTVSELCENVSPFYISKVEKTENIMFRKEL